MRVRRARLFGLALLVPALGCAAAEPVVDYAAEEQAIRANVADWNDFIAARDVAAVTALYAADGYIAPPAADLAQGHAEIEAVWTSLLALPELELTIRPTDVEVARAGDMAYENGTFTMSFAAGEQRLQDRGKYVVVWEKRDGEWKVVADVFNSSVPTAD